MIRTLFIIAGAALVLSIASFGGAFALGGVDLKRHGWTWTIDEDADGDTVVRRGGPAEDLGPDVTRTLPFTGGDTLEIELGSDVTYVQGPEATVVVTGPQSVVDRVRLDGTRLWMEEGQQRLTLRWTGTGLHGWSDSEKLKITVTAPSVTRFDVEGSADVVIRNYDHPTMALDISGSGEIDASGKTGTLELDIAGSGEADLSDLVVTDANVGISGSGEARVGPTGAADISISGSGEVDLTERPATLNQTVSGSGEVNVARTSTTIKTTREIARVPGVTVSTSREVPAP